MHRKVYQDAGHALTWLEWRPRRVLRQVERCVTVRVYDPDTPPESQAPPAKTTQHSTKGDACEQAKHRE